MGKIVHPVTCSLDLYEDNSISLTFTCRDAADADAAFEAIAEILKGGADLGTVHFGPAATVIKETVQ